MVWYRDKRIKLEYGMSIMDKRIETRARRLNARAIVANDHTDNEVQQNVTPPRRALHLQIEFGTTVTTATVELCMG